MDGGPVRRLGTDAPLQPTVLPAWPLATLLAGYPIWWIGGFVDFAWVLFPALMLVLLVRHGDVQVPRGFGVWLGCILWMTLSASQLDSIGRLIGFSYRHLLYIGGTVLFVYVYNARQRLTDRYVAGLLTVLYGITVAGGFLGMLFPGTTVRTPFSYVLPRAIASNELVGHMVVRRFAEYNPDGYFQIAPRPAAPFIYTNNWGNAYSLLLPFAIVYLFQCRGTRRFWFLLALIPISLIPAAATLNRGMFLGIGVAGVYLAFRYVLLGNAKVLIALIVCGAIGIAAFSQSPWESELADRTERTGTNSARTETYTQTIISVKDSPFFGVGGPTKSDDPNLPPVGSHGQFWIVLHAHGVMGALLFVGWFLVAFCTSLRRRDPVGLVSNAILLVGMMEMFYYGLMPVGFMILMMAAALGLRRPTRARVDAARAVATARIARQRQPVRSPSMTSSTPG